MKKRITTVFVLSLFGLGAMAQTPVDTAFYLNNIEVTGSRFAGISGGEVKRLNVERNLSSISVTAADAFRQLPSVVTDIEGGVTYRGSNRVGMLIDGIPYGLLEEYSGDVLIQLPALFFNRIALSAYPSISLVPDGDAGVMGLESSVPGDSPLTVTLGGGWHERYNAGAVLNLNPGKFHIVAKYNYRKEFRDRTYSKQTTNKQTQTSMNNNASARPDVHMADLRISYDLSDKDQISVYGLYHLMDYSRYGRIDNQVLNAQGDLMKHVIRNRYNDQRQEAFAAEARWEHRFNERAMLYATVNFNNFDYDEDNDFKNENPQNGKIVAEDNQFINQTKRQYYWTLGYRQRFDEGWRLEAGYIGRAKEELYDTDVNAKTDGVWGPTNSKCYDYVYNRYLNLLFASVGKNWENGWDAEIGFQAELNRQVMDEYSPLWETRDESDNNRFHFYPRARVAYQASGKSRWTLGYQQRVNRPTGANLSSFVDQSDATHIIAGNPALKDEFVHTLELGYELALPGFRLTPSIYYRNRSNRIMEVATQVDDQTIWQKQNVGNSQSVGVDVAANWRPVKWMTVGLAGDLYRDEIDGRTVGYGEKKSMWCGDVKANLNFSITPTTELQLDGFFISDQLTAQGKIDSRYTVNAGISQYFLDRKLCANLSVNNLFDSLEETTIIDTPDLQMTQHRNRDACVAWLTLTYSL